MKKYGGMAAALLSAFLFGSTAILAKWTYLYGSNPVMLTFLRALFALPVLFLVLRLRHVSLRLSRREARDILLVGFLGFAPTGLLLYGSFVYIPVGFGTVLHFMFPVVVTLGGVLLYRQKIGPAKLLALGFAMVGVLLFFEGAGQAGLLGTVLALASAVTYSVYILGVERTSLFSMPKLKLTFYFSLCASLFSGGLALCTGNLTFAIQPLGYLYSFLISMLVAVGAFTLLQLAITLCGATTAAILSTLEPITAVALGVLLLGEGITPKKMLGCVFILAAVTLITMAGAAKPKTSAAEP